MGDTEFMEDVRAEAERMAREVFARDEGNQTVIADLETQRRLTKLENLYLDGDISKERYRSHKAIIDEASDKLENKLYTASQTGNINTVIRRIESSLKQLNDASGETKKGCDQQPF